MADFHEIVDQIRGIVQSSDQTRNERMEQLAVDYASACAEVNQRLGRCQWLLQQGLRSEAIQLAASEPRLLDAVAVLDFRERAEWDDLIGIYGLTSPPKLMVEAAGFLNEAYAQDEPLQDLLAKHRRLAMQRSPLRMRIGIIRQLAAQDPNNLVWDDDLRAFEKARFRQMQVEAAEAVRLQDPPHLARLLAEVQKQKWVEPPPKALAQGLAKADAQLRGQQVRAAMVDLDARLNEAFATRDPIRGRSARNEWVALTASAPLDPSDPISERVGPALSWLDDEDRRDAADRDHGASLDSLVKALDEPGFIPPAELERLGQAVLSHGRGMPEAHQQRFLSRLRASETARSRRLRLIISGAAAGIMLTTGLVFALVRGQLRAGEASQAAVSITDLIELGEFDRAGEFIKTLETADPGLLAYPPMIDARQRFEAAQARESQRQLQFDKALREAEQAPLATPDSKALEGARSLARRETEKQAIDQLVEHRRASLQTERARQEMALRPRIEEMRQAVYEIERRLESPPVEEARIQESISTMQRTLVDMAPQVALTGDELKGLAQDLGQMLEGSRNRLGRVHRQSQILEEITTAIAYSPADPRDTVGPFTQALQAYIQADPTSARSRALQDVLKERPLWESLDAWSRVSTGWKLDPSGLGHQEAKTRAALCAQFLSQHRAFPNADAVARYGRFAEAIGRRTPGVENNPQSTLRRLLSDILVDHVWMVSANIREADGRIQVRRYYTKERPAENGGLVRFMSLISFSGKEQARAITREMVASVGVSPQSKIAAAFKPILADESKLVQWERVMRDLCARILDEPDIDPILQVALLRRVLDSAVEGSEPLKEALGPMKTRFDAAQVDINVPWMSPETDNLERNHAMAAQVIDLLRRLLPPAKAIDTLRDKVEHDVLQTYPTVGWLAKDRDDWRVRTGGTVPKQGDLWVVLPSDKTGRLKKVGKLDGGKPAIDVRDSTTLAEGRPVFLVRETR
jgi:hypothetical protein